MSPNTRPYRILVAEDDKEMRRLVSDALESDGHQVVDVGDGSQLLIRITNHYRLNPDPEPIDLIITDNRMPLVTGLEIVQGLRDANWTVPIVIMTAFSDDETRERASELNAVLIDKPFTMQALRVIVGALLKASA